MSDIIRLLPDSVANQIAAGEVVQRPASAVKELLENALDAGATEIRLMIRDAGRLLIQVTDNGCGMSEQDARMCFERHATSKIRKADDLLAIRTMGFRGEALASIASVAQVELRTKRHEDEIGTEVLVDGSEFKSQSPVNCPNGTSVSVRNLFFNVPARRNFLKSNTLELKHIIEAFFRVALVNPDIHFTFYNQDKILHQLTPGNLRQRIVAIFGPSYSQRLIPVEQQTGVVNLTGFITKPEFAKKTRGEQYFFTNGRFMKSPYLQHSVESAFKDLIPGDSVPSYFVYLEVDPGTIDVNIHPTKTEINFQDMQSIYAILHAAVKQTIGRFTLTPAFDFESEQTMNIPPLQPGQSIRPPVINVNPDYNPFEKRTEPQTSFSFHTNDNRRPDRGWQDFFSPSPVSPGAGKPETGAPDLLPGETPQTTTTVEPAGNHGWQIRDSYLVTHTRAGILIIDQQHAHERILFEEMVDPTPQNPVSGQRLLMPVTIALSPADSVEILDWIDHFNRLGIEITDFGNGTFLIHSLPATLPVDEAKGFIESVLESVKENGADPDSERKRTLAGILSRKLAVKRGTRLPRETIDHLIEKLLVCKAPAITPDGRPTMVQLTFEELNTKFKHKGH